MSSGAGKPGRECRALATTLTWWWRGHTRRIPSLRLRNHATLDQWEGVRRGRSPRHQVFRILELECRHLTMSDFPSSAWMVREFSPSPGLWRNLVFPHMATSERRCRRRCRSARSQGHPRLVHLSWSSMPNASRSAHMRAPPSCSIGRPRCARRRDGANRCGVARTQPCSPNRFHTPPCSHRHSCVVS